MPPEQHPLTWLHHAGQHLAFVPSLGGGVAAWQVDRPGGLLDLWRPWDGASTDRFTLASFPILPWSNRISGGGFAYAGRFHPIALNRAGEPYPIHGDGWLQAWTLDRRGDDTVEMRLSSRRFAGNPHDYDALQAFRLVPGGLDQDLTVTHQGDQPLPYGLGQHPYFLRTPQARLTASVTGVWLSGADPMPTGHSDRFPPGWNLNEGIPVHGEMIDNGFTGWSGEAHIDWPEHGLRLTLRVPGLQQAGGGYCLLYRPPEGLRFAFEPITHPIDAFHLPGQPGLRVLGRGESLSLRVQWRLR